MQRILPLGLLLLCLLTGCTQNLFRSATKTTYPKLTVAQDYQYHIRKDDKITVSVWDHEELSVGSIYSQIATTPADSKWVLVDAKGTVGLPRVGPFSVQDLTIPEAEANLRQTLEKWIVNPQVTIKVLNRQATVLGEVYAPGPVLLEKERNTLVEVLGRAGDFKDYADKTHVKMLRTAPDGTMSETQIDLTQTNQVELNTLEVLPGDVVYVPARRGKELSLRAGTAVAVTSGFSALLLLTRLILAL